MMVEGLGGDPFMDLPGDVAVMRQETIPRNPRSPDQPIMGKVLFPC